jgi:Asp/Glu/hydantoin racemase
MKARGGKNIYGYPIGILTLETQFPRIPGDMGNATTWNFPILYKIIRTATPDAVVRKGDQRLLELFIAASQELEREGVRAITTNCGFLAMFQKEISSAVSVPVFTSSLMQVPMVYYMLKPSQKVGIITIHSKSLTDKHLSSVGADTIPHVVMGTEGEKEFSRSILNNELDLDVETSRDELVKVAEEMVFEYPEVGAIVLECTNMTPYALDIQEEIGLPVFDIFTLVTMVYHAVVRKRFTGIM